MQLLDILGTIIAQRVAFEVIPAILIRIQFGCIGRQAFDVQARMSIEKFADLFSPMSIQSIPNQKHLPAQMSQELLQKGNHLFLTNRAIGMKFQIPTQSATTRRDRDRSDDRKMAVMTGACSQHGGVAPGSPRSSHQRAQENAGFVDPNQPGLKSRRFFLIRSQSHPIQRCTACSSRSWACRSGF